ncbi:MAG: PHP domain-containing protein, partial [Gammaproteobacteria bacterium]|nr:PHP domain-containing protein [Gammaproteobacteria bacterium]
MASRIGYAELHCLSNFTFLRGASHAEELVQRAAELGYRALAITDECSVSGVVRAHVAAQAVGLHLVIGSEFTLDDGLRLVLLATDRSGYGQLCQLITVARRAAAKGEYRLTRTDLEQGAPGCLALWMPAPQPSAEQLLWLRERFEGRLWIAVELFAAVDDGARLEMLTHLGREYAVPLVACGDVHMHVRGRRALQDTLTAIRLRTTVAAAVPHLYPNGERHLRSLARLRELYPPQLLDASVAIARRCRFSLDELRYEYPRELVPDGHTPATYLRQLTEQGARRRWPGGVSASVRKMIEHELELIEEMRYEQYFLTVHEIVEFARGRDILCQGRGSAANSAVCFCLGITEVDPARMSMLFERFISRERNEPPDIDVDFEHERREEVIQHIYEKYGRERAALTATVTSYRARSAVRDVAKALGLDLLQVDRLTRSLGWWEGEIAAERIRDAGFDPDS